LRASAACRSRLGETLLALNGRQERLIDGLLLLARSDRELPERSYVDLADIADHPTGQLTPGPVTVLTKANPAPTRGNPVLLERLVLNLLDNGCRHNVGPDGWVAVTTDTGPGGVAVMVVTNTGPTIPPYEISRLFEPFRRLGADRPAAGAPKGVGLGLSIVQAVVRAHGGDVRADPREGGGLIVTVTLPPAPQDPG
jgi:signal transduction histidine kinase